MFKLVEAADAAGEHGEEDCREDMRGDLGMGAGVTHLPPPFAEVEYLVCVF